MTYECSQPLSFSLFSWCSPTLSFHLSSVSISVRGDIWSVVECRKPLSFLPLHITFTDRAGYERTHRQTHTGRHTHTHAHTHTHILYATYKQMQIHKETLVKDTHTKKHTFMCTCLQLTAILKWPLRPLVCVGTTMCLPSLDISVNKCWSFSGHWYQLFLCVKRHQSGLKQGSDLGGMSVSLF